MDIQYNQPKTLSARRSCEGLGDLKQRPAPGGALFRRIRRLCIRPGLYRDSHRVR